jgi:ParB family transcriptional regulator, chromosome partitioning protein
VVKQRLRLASVSPALLAVYTEDGMNLDQLMAFTVGPDHARQEQVLEAVQKFYSKEPYTICRMLTEGAVRASDRRAQFVGAEAYEDAGGVILRDLFNADEGGWWQDVRLLDRLVMEKLEREALAVRAEGWRWIDAMPELPYGHSYRLRRLHGEPEPLSDEERAAREALQAEYDALEAACESVDEIPEETDQCLSEIETALQSFEERPLAYDPAEVAIAGAFVSIDGSGWLSVQRGFVRPEDEPKVESVDEDGGVHNGGTVHDGADLNSPTRSAAAGSMLDDNVSAEEPEDEGVRPLPDRLVTELTAHRTLALREALANDPDLAHLAALHALTLRLFHRYGLDSCLEIEPKSALFGAHAPGRGETASAQAIETRHAAFAERLSREPEALWGALAALDADSRQALFAHAVALTVNAVQETYNRRMKAMGHADRLAEALKLDVAEAGWRPSVESYLGRVTKGRILEAVREARGERAAQRNASLKKPEIAAAAERLLDGTG